MTRIGQFINLRILSLYNPKILLNNVQKNKQQTEKKKY